MAMNGRLQAAALLALLAGCGVEAPVDGPVEPPECPLAEKRLVLSYSELLFDADATFEVTGADPGAEVTFWWTAEEAAGCTCPVGHESCVELPRAVRLGAAIADE